MTADRQQIEASLRQSEERYRAFIEQSAEAIWRFELRDPLPVTFNPDEQIEHCYRHGYLAEGNDSMARMYGYERASEIIGAQLNDLLPRANAANVEYLRAFIQSGYRLTEAESQEVDRDGNPKYFTNNLIGIVEDGKMLRVWGTQRDITERRQAEEALRKYQQRLEFTLESAKGGDWDLDLLTGKAQCSFRHDQCFGATEPIPDWGYEKFLSYVHPDDRANEDRKFRAAVDSGRDWSIDCRVIWPDGSVHWIESSGRNYRYVAGKPTRMLGMVRDVTEHKQIVQALEESEKQSREILESVKDGFFTLDEDFRFFYVNGEAGNILDRKPGELLGKTLWEAYPGIVGNMFEEVYRRVMSGGAAESFTACYPDQDRWYEVRVYPARIGISVYFRNVTERRQAEADTVFLAELAEHIRVGDDADELLADASRLVGQHLQVARAYFTEMDEARDRWQVRDDYHAALSSVAGEYRISDYPADILERLRSGRVLAIEDAQRDPRTAQFFTAAYAPFGIHAHVSVPLLRDGHWVLSLVAATDQPHLWQPREIELLTTIAERVWLAVERLRADQQLRRSHDTFLNLIEGAPFGVYLVDAEFRMAQASAGAQKAFSNIRPLLGRDFAEVVQIAWPEPFASEVIARFRHTLATGEPYRARNTIEQRSDIDALESYDWRIERITLPDSKHGVVCYFYDLSERQQAEAALRASEAEFRQLANTVPQIVWVTGADGKLEYINEQWIKFSGLTLAETNTPEIVSEVIHPDDREMVFGKLAQAFESGTPYQLEARMRQRATGEYCWFLMRSEPTKDEAGNAVKWFGTSTDIHEQKQSEADARLLNEIGERIRLAEDTPSLLWEVTRAVGEHLQVSNAFFTEVEVEQGRFRIHRDYHVGPRSLAGSYDRSAFGPALIKELMAGHVAVVRDAATDSRIADSFDNFKQYGICAVVAVPLLRNDRQVSSLIVTTTEARDWTTREITLLETVAERTWLAVEKLRLDAVLRERTDLLNAILENTTEPIYVKDRESRIVTANPALERVLGMPAAELIGKNEYDFLKDRTEAEEIMANDRRIMESGQGEILEEPAATAIGKRIYLSNKAAWRDAQGKVIGLIGISSDITERKQAEEKIARLLAEEQAARVEAERATRLKDEFLGLVSHELRSPLNAISGWVKLMRGGRLTPDDTARALFTIERNAVAQNHLIEDLLDVSRIVAGKLKLELQVIEAHTAIEAAFDSALPAAEAKGVHLKMLSTPLGIALNADPDRLQQAVWNLLSNAIKFTPAGGHVSVKLAHVNHYIEITVTDSGIGIEPDFLPYVFERFRQADATSSRKYGGLGLGLAIVRHIIELHGGEVQADSAGERQGAAFTLKLPLVAGAQSAGVHPVVNSATLELPAAIAARLVGLRVLAIDDEEAGRDILKLMLNNYGLRVTNACSAAEGLQALQSNQFDALVCDIFMPEVDGYAFIRQVREQEAGSGRRLPAIALTGFARGEDRVRALGAGFDSHVSKPVEPVELAIVLATLAERSGR